MLLLGIVPLIYPLTKVLSRSDINVFDIFQITTCLYYVLIPIKILYIDLPILKPYYINDLVTPSYYLSFNCVLLFINFLWTRTNRLRYTPINITRYIRKIDTGVILKKKHAYLFIIFFCLLLIPLTNYSGLSEDTTEENLTAGYGLNVSFFDRIRLVFLYNTYPVFMLLSLKYYNQKNLLQYRKLAIICLVLGTLCVFLASKSVMFFTILVSIVYFYAVEREKLNSKFIVKSLVASALVVFVLFPLSQNFRTIKQTLVKNGTAHGFMDVATAFVDIDVSQEKNLTEKYQMYKARSLNVYQAFQWACTKDFRGEGRLTLMVYKYLIPQFLNPKEGNILGDVYFGKDADIGESLLTWFVADWGIIGVLVTILHFFVVVNIWILYNIFFRYLFKDKKGEYLFIVLFLMEFITIELNPAGYFHGFYSERLISYIVYIIVFKLFDSLTKSSN